MPLKKLTMKPGVNRENTRYTNENGWYDCDKIRFRQGTPEKIGGWTAVTPFETYLGVCRSLWAWATNSSAKYLGVGTSLKFYIEAGAAYYDITPIRSTTAAGDVQFNASTGSSTIEVYDTGFGGIVGDFVTFSGAVGLGGAITATILNQQYQIVTVINADTYTITVSAVATGFDGGNGGYIAVGAYQVSVGPAIQVPAVGWGTGPWAGGPWGTGSATLDLLRVWNQQNFGQDLIYGPAGGPVYYWSASVATPLLTRGVALSSLGGPVLLTYLPALPAVITLSSLFSEGTPVKLAANTGGALPAGINSTTTYYIVNINVDTLTALLSLTPGGDSLVVATGAGAGTFYIATLVDVPLTQNQLIISDTSRFVITFGTNDYFSTTADPMLIRWSNQEDPLDWTSTVTNQAGSIRLSHGSAIVAVAQTRQEILVWTDTSLYSLQYTGSPYVWSVTLLSDNITINSDRAWSTVAGKTYWMGADKFYVYDGTANTLKCDLRQYIFDDVPGFNISQPLQVFSSSVEKFNEVWWFYCSVNSTTVDRYAIYNYLEGLWYYGTMGRTAWIDAGVNSHNPIAADDLNKKLQYQEYGVDDNATGAGGVGFTSFVTSAEFDLDDGNNFAFVWRVLPDVTFRGSTADNPALTMYLLPLANSGSGYNNNTSTNSNQSVASSSYSPITRSGVYPVEQFTGQINTRVRGRQMSIKVESTAAGIQWQLGSPRLDIRQDGRR
jgi:hypothetical protein